MKKFSLIIWLALIASVVHPIPTAYASDADDYYLITANSTPLYSDADGNSFVIFYVIKDCYAKKTGDSVNGYAHVSYMGIEGYISLSDVDNKTYADLTFTGTAYYHEKIVFTLGTGAFLTAEPGGKRALTGVNNSAEFTLLGVALMDGKEYACTKYGNGATDYGYVPVSQTSWMPTLNRITAPTLRVEPPSNNVPTPSPQPDDQTFAPVVKSDKNEEIVRILLVAGICIPVIIVLILVFKPVKHPYGHYDLDNYDDYNGFDDLGG